jgi:hypothetical protein
MCAGSNVLSLTYTGGYEHKTNYSDGSRLHDINIIAHMVILPAKSVNYWVFPHFACKNTLVIQENEDRKEIKVYIM